MMFENTPLTNLWYGCKVVTGLIASILSIILFIFGLMALMIAPAFGLFLLFVAGFCYWFQNDLLKTLDAEERMRIIRLDHEE